MHLAFNNVRYSPDASSNVNYFLFCGGCEEWSTYQINENNTANATHGPSSPTNVPRLNVSDAGLERSGTRTWTGTNTTGLQDTVTQKSTVTTYKAFDYCWIVQLIKICTDQSRPEHILFTCSSESSDLDS